MNTDDQHLDVSNEPIDPIVDLVRNAIGCGVLMALEGGSDLIAKLSALPADGSWRTHSHRTPKASCTPEAIWWTRFLKGGNDSEQRG